MKEMRQLQIEEVAVEALRADPANPRRISAHQLEALTRSLQEYGFVQPVLARRADATVIGGHQRLVAARRLGYKSIPVIWLDLSVDESRLLNLALNRIAGEWDEELLVRLLSDLSEDDELDLSLSGFEEDELETALRSLGSRDRRERPESFDLDAVLAQASLGGRVKQGEVWQLGAHRFLCGDATVPNDVARLMARTRAAVAFTDPPYNVALGDHGGKQAKQPKRRLRNDALSPEAWEAFVRGWARTLLANVDGAIYVCMSSKEWPLVARVLGEEGGHWSDTIIWAKDRFVLGRADYQRQDEPVWYGWREGAQRHWRGDRDQGDVWRVARATENEAHPTMKPLPLIERAIENSSRAGAVVLDLFLGSVSSLIACERTNRVCLGMEIDPVYAAVAIGRWEQFTGQVAARVPAAESEASE